MSKEREMHDPDDRSAGTDDEALAVLRGIWTAQSRSAVDIAPGNAKVCRNMKNIGFGGLGAPDAGAEGGSTAGPVEDDQRVAWRERLVREGKIAPGAISVRDLLMGGSQNPGEPTA